MGAIYDLTMTNGDMQNWLDRYIAAWRANTAALIEELFTEGAVYRFHPYDEGDDVATGREAIVAAWLESPDDPDGWEARYRAFAVEGNRGVGVGTTRYLPTADEPEEIFHNCFLLTFAEDGRCSEFTEFFALKT